MITDLTAKGYLLLYAKCPDAINTALYNIEVKSCLEAENVSLWLEKEDLTNQRYNESFDANVTTTVLNIMDISNLTTGIDTLDNPGDFASTSGNERYCFDLPTAKTLMMTIIALEIFKIILGFSRFFKKHLKNLMGKTELTIPKRKSKSKVESSKQDENQEETDADLEEATKKKSENENTDEIILKPRGLQILVAENISTEQSTSISVVDSECNAKNENEENKPKNPDDSERQTQEQDPRQEMIFA